jgi:hypothetical protein
MPRARFETAIPATKRPQTFALDRADTGFGCSYYNGDSKLYLSSINFPQDLTLDISRNNHLCSLRLIHVFHLLVLSLIRYSTLYVSALANLTGSVVETSS